MVGFGNTIEAPQYLLLGHLNNNKTHVVTKIIYSTSPYLTDLELVN